MSVGELHEKNLSPTIFYSHLIGRKLTTMNYNCVVNSCELIIYICSMQEIMGPGQCVHCHFKMKEVTAGKYTNKMGVQVRSL